MVDPRAISHGEKSSSKGERGLMKRLDALAKLTPLTGQRLLDIGCADGSYTSRLAAGFDRIEAIDIEPERLDDFRASISGTPLAKRTRISEMSADELTYDDGSFDMVTAIEVVEHVADLDRTFGEIARVLTHGGRFLLTTPNRWFPFETHGPIIRGKRRRVWAAPGITWIPSVHRRFSDARAFTRTDLVKRGQDVGLRLVGHSYMMPPFDTNPIGRRVRPVADAVESGPFAVLGMAHVMVFRKP